MLPKEERKKINQAFWDGFKKEMRRHNSRHRRNINWLKYPTEIRHVYLRLHCDNIGAFLSFDIQFKDPGIRDLFWEQLTELKQVMNNEMGDKGQWLKDLSAPEGFVFDRIQWHLEGVSFYRSEDWPVVYSFFKERLIAFDRFYQEFKEVLILLVD